MSHKEMKEINQRRAIKDFDKICKRKKYDTELIKSNRRHAEVVEMRADIAKKMRKLGYSYPMIGFAMNRDHTTIMNLDNDARRNKNKIRCRQYMRNRNCE